MVYRAEIIEKIIMFIYNNLVLLTFVRQRRHERGNFMIKNVTKKLGAAVLVLTLIGHPLTAYAADPYLNIGSATAHVSVQKYSNKYNSTWVSIINNGIAAWNNSSAVVSIAVSNSSSNTIEAAQYNDSWYGMTTLTGNSKYAIKINARTIQNQATNYSNFATSTVVHEYGHVYWLCDNPNTTRASIMKYNRDRNSMTTPQSFDINNVNAKY